MVKPSSTRLSKRHISEESFLKAGNMSGIKKILINAPKMDVHNKKKRRRTKKKIKKLFEQLKSESNTTIDSSMNSTVVLLDDTVQECPKEASPSNKRKLSETSLVERDNFKKTNSTSVVITDEVVLLDSTNETCSSINNTVLNANDISAINKKENNAIIKKTPLNNDDDVVINNDSFNINDDENNKAKNKEVILESVPSFSKTPRKLFAPPMNCSTPLSKSNNNTINNNADTTKNFNNDSNVTKEINKDSYLTIDLTTETAMNRSSVSKTENNTVIDLDNTQDSQDCTFVSISNTSLSMSGDSDVTVVRNNSRKRMNKFVNGIAKLDASEKGKLLELITQKIFSGCKIPEKIASASNVRQSSNKGTETVENSYIKEIILGEKTSRNSIGSNIYNPSKDQKNKTGLRMIVIDGSNVAMQHGNGRVFSVRGLQICIDYFLKRGHVVKAFVPRFRCKYGKSTEPRLLDELERRGLVVYTPSREIHGRNICSYDDRYIVQCAAEFEGVIVSGDNYRDLHRENPRWRTVIENRLLPFTWVEDMIMFPKDPLGRNGPSLETFLRHPVTKPSVFTIN